MTPIDTETALALSKLHKEILEAREKHPRNRWQFEALCEELGEASWVRASLVSGELEFAPGNPEMLHVACVAMRIYVEGTTPIERTKWSTHGNILAELGILGGRAKRALRAEGVPD